MATNDTKLFVIQAMAMNLSEQETLSYLKDKGTKISRISLYRLKREIKNNRQSRLSLIAKEKFVDQYLERIDQLETIQKQQWSLYNNESNNFKKSQILVNIAALQDQISNYYDNCRYVLEKQVLSVPQT
jgi:hypothetical protein